MLKNGNRRVHFRFRTLEEAQRAACAAARYCPDPVSAACALSELAINAVEHGNLGIGYHEKTKLVIRGAWEEEITTRLQQPENKDKFASLTVLHNEQGVTITIRDQGHGFNWQEYMRFDPKRLTHPHGRGIAMACRLCFSDLQYRKAGREVVCHLETGQEALVSAEA